jgi:hypothetical protein
MITDFEKIKLFGAFISKEYSAELLRLLYLYKDISASEAASRMGMHIKTVQEFFDALYAIGLLEKREVYESKRPYFRYSFNLDKIDLSLNVKEIIIGNKAKDNSDLFIREKKNASVRFTTSRSKLFFSSVSVWIGQGRETTEKKVSLTIAQGKFLFNLPFPNADFSSISEIMMKSEVGEEYSSEIMDIVNLLIENGVIEIRE